MLHILGLYSYLICNGARLVERTKLSRSSSGSRTRVFYIEELDCGMFVYYNSFFLKQFITILILNGTLMQVALHFAVYNV